MINFNTSRVVNFTRPEDTEPVKPELFYTNKRALRDLEVNVSYGKTNLQKIVNGYQAITGTIPTLEEIKSWFGQKRNDFLVANEGAIKKSIWERLDEKPDLSSLLEACHKLVFVNPVDAKEVFYWDVYRIESGNIVLIQEEVQIIQNTFRAFAITLEEKERLESVRQLCAYMEKIKLTDPARLMISGIVTYDEELRSLVPHENYVKGFLK